MDCNGWKSFSLFLVIMEVCFLYWGEICAIIKHTNPNPAFCKQTRSALLKETSTRKQTERNVQKRGQFDRTYSRITNIVF